MEDFLELITTNYKIIVAFISVSFLIFRSILYFKKSRIDFKEANEKKAKLSIYLADSYKLNIDDQRACILFNVRITNLSSTKNSLTATVEIKYLDNILKLVHSPELFDEIPNKNLIQIDSDINLVEKEMKSGWLIFEYPASLKNTLIDQFEVKVEDGSGNTASVTSVLMKDMIYAE